MEKPVDIDAFISAVEALDEEQLNREADELRTEIRRLTIELIKRLDALEVKSRWEQQRDPTSSGDLPPFGHGSLPVTTNRMVLTTPPASGGIPSAEAVGAPTVASEGPRGTAAVRFVMREGGNWRVRDVFRELTKRGWVSTEAKHPEKATETALHRLLNKGEIERVGHGLYHYKGAPVSQSSFENGGVP